MNAEEPWLPLAGIRVLDFSLLLPGPLTTLMLADLGADVVKVEPLSGDFGREIPMAMFRMANRNKRSLALDLKHPDSRGVVERLARWADVAIEGFRPGVAERLGVGYATLAALNPRLVYCSLSGYGKTGPDRMRPGHDLNYLAASGAMALASHWSEPPKRCGLPVADLAGGCYSAIAILAALRARDATGRGAELDLSLAESAMSFAAIRHGLDLDEVSRGHLWPTNDLFETADGERIALGIVEPQFWRNFVAAAGDLEPALADPRYADEPGRRRHGDELAATMRRLLLRRSAAEWLPLFERHDVPAQLALTPAQASRTPQIAARRMVLELNGERHIPFPVHADGRRGGVLRNTAPAVGEHADEILAELGVSADELAQLRRSGVLGKREEAA